MIEPDKKKHLALIKFIGRLKTKKQKNDPLETEDELTTFLNRCDDHSIDEICECMYNIIHTDMNLPKSKKTKLKHLIKNQCPINHLSKITKKSVPVSNRRKALKQVGGALVPILLTAIPFLIDLIFGKKK